MVLKGVSTCPSGAPGSHQSVFTQGIFIQTELSNENTHLFLYTALLQQNLLSIPGQSQSGLLHQHQPGLALTPQVLSDLLLDHLFFQVPE